MIRPVTPYDTKTFIAIALEAGLFSVDESPFLDKMLSDYFERNKDQGHICIIAEEEEGGEGMGVAYYEPARATDRTWYLTMIAVRRDRQGQGVGTALMEDIEQTLQKDGQRILLVETSGVTEFARTREFYLKCGYIEEARIRDFYVVGDDMILFRKEINKE